MMYVGLVFCSRPLPVLLPDIPPVHCFRHPGYSPCFLPDFRIPMLNMPPMCSEPC